jgi:hypothetical protein
MLAERPHLRTCPWWHVVERLGIRVKHPGALEVHVEHIQIDELRAPLICSLSDCARKRLLARLGHDRHDLSGLHVRSKRYSKLGKRADVIKSSAHLGETYAHETGQRNPRDLSLSRDCSRDRKAPQPDDRVGDEQMTA